MPYVWLGVLIAALIIEALTADFVSIWFAPAALITMILAFCRIPWLLQVPLFLLLGLLFVILTRPLVRRLKKGKGSKTNVDALLDSVALVTEEICNIRETGEVKLNGLRWSARSADPGVVIPKGSQVRILSVEGVKLIVKY